MSASRYAPWLALLGALACRDKGGDTSAPGGGSGAPDTAPDTSQDTAPDPETGDDTEEPALVYCTDLSSALAFTDARLLESGGSLAVELDVASTAKDCVVRGADYSVQCLLTDANIVDDETYADQALTAGGEDVSPGQGIVIEVSSELSGSYLGEYAARCDLLWESAAEVIDAVAVGEIKKDGGDDPPEVDSCAMLDYHICFEYDGYADTEAWCEMIAIEYGTPTGYFEEPCSGGSVGACDLPVSGDFEYPATAYYYPPSFDADSAESSCESAGGTPL